MRKAQALRSKQYREGNRLSWDEATPLHEKARGNQAASFRRGLNRLAAVERRELGDIRGLSALHLQCNCGLDTLSLALLGANVTGVDISGKAVAVARRLAQESRIPATFTRSDIYAYRPRKGFDLVYTGKGSLYWLPELAPWARLIFESLKPGGFLYVFEEHPLVSFFHELEPTRYNPGHGKYSYFHRAQPVSSLGLDYVGFSGKGKRPAYEWQWTLGDIVTSLASAGLRLEFLHEWDFANFKIWTYLRESGGVYRLPPERPQLPLSFTLRMTRPL